MAQDIWLPMVRHQDNPDKDAMVREYRYQLHVESMNLEDGPLKMRMFNYEKSSSRSSLLAKIKVFGAVNANVHLLDYDGQKIRGTEMEIPEIYIEGDVVVKYELVSQKKFSQLILLGFVKRPSVRLMNVKYSEFPRGLFKDAVVDPVARLESAIETLLEMRGPDNSFSIHFESPFDS